MHHLSEKDAAKAARKAAVMEKYAAQIRQLDDMVSNEDARQLHWAASVVFLFRHLTTQNKAPSSRRRWARTAYSLQADARP